MEQKMEKKILIFMAEIMAFCAIIGNGILFFAPQLREEKKKQEEYRQEKQKEEATMLLAKEKNAEAYLRDISYRIERAEVRKKMKVELKKQIVLTLPQNTSKTDVKVEQDRLRRTITIKIPKAGKEYFKLMPPDGPNPHLIEMTSKVVGETAILQMRTDQVMEVQKTANRYFCTLSFLTPQEVYDKVVVVDAGHGAKSIGEVADGTKEKDVNLAIAQKLKEKLQAQGIGVYCTRTKDVNPTEQARAELANGVHADYLISIHCNAMQNKKFSYIYGIEGSYKDKKKGDAARKLAEQCVENAVLRSDSVNRGIQKDEQSVLLKKSKVPTVLVRVGFLSNDQERKKLTDQVYQEAIAQGLCDAIVTATEGDGK